MIKIGVIGCGHWGSNHVRIFYMSRKAELKCCCDTDRNRLKAMGGLYPNITTTSDPGEIIDDAAVDAVVIATPTVSHYSLVKKALLKGKHVLCEKPLTVESGESRELLALARKKGKVLMVGYVFLFNNGIIALKGCLKKKSLGKLCYLHFTRTNLGPIRDDVDVIYDLASHDIAIASFLLNKWPKAVSANAGFFLRKKISDTAFITLYYSSSVIVNIHVSWLDPRKIRCITCVGDQKMGVWDDLNANEPLRIFNKGVVKEPYYSDYGEFQLLPREGEVVSPLIRLVEPLKNQNFHFLDCVENNKKPLTDAKFGHNVTKILETSHLSIRNQGRIKRVRW